MSVKGYPQSPVINSEVSSSETLPETQEIEAFSLKEDDQMNVSELQSYYADMPELQFHQMMQDVDFFAQEFNDPVFEFQSTFSNLVNDYRVDPEPEVHARTSIQSAENLIEPEWMYNIGERESNFSNDSGQIINENYDSEASCSEYYSCEEEDGSEQVLGHFDKVENVLNLLHEISQSPAVQSFADFVPECVVPFYTPKPVQGTVLFDEGVSIQEDQPRGKSELSKDTSPSFGNEEPLPIDLSSALHVDNHDESIPECDLDDCAFWSILTDTVSYYQKDHVSSLVLESDSTDTQDTYYTCAKEMYFCAANNNVPHMNEENKHEQNFSLSVLMIIFALKVFTIQKKILKVNMNTSWQLIATSQS